MVLRLQVVDRASVRATIALAQVIYKYRWSWQQWGKSAASIITDLVHHNSDLFLEFSSTFFMWAFTFLKALFPLLIGSIHHIKTSKNNNKHAKGSRLTEIRIRDDPCKKKKKNFSKESIP